MFQQTKRLTAGALLAGAIVTASGGVAMAGQGTAFAATPSQHLARVVRKAARHPLAARVLTVKSVSATTIAATTAAGIPITIDLSSATTFSEAGATVTISAVQAGERIRVSGSYDQVTRTAQAKKVVIVVPSVAGVVTSVSGSTITLTDRNAVQHTIAIGSSATFERAGQSAGLQDMIVGSVVTVQGTTNADGTMNVLRVVIHVPQFAGTVATVSGSSFTLTTRAGTTYTVTTTSSTIYAVAATGGKLTRGTTAPTITTGERALVQGTLNGTTIDALRIALRQPKARTNSTSTTTPNA